MGGYGCMKLALKHPGLYCAVASLSGFLSLDPFDYFRTNVLAENGGHGPYDPAAGFFSYASYTAGGAFSPNMSRPPYYVDLPIDSTGNLIDSVFTRWRLQMPAHLVHLDTVASLPAVYFDCGEQDELGFYPMNQNFAAILDSLSIPYYFTGYTGGHQDHIYERGGPVFSFLDSVLRAGASSAPEVTLKPQQFALLQNYPNPFNSSTTIEFALPHSGRVSLAVFNLLGQEVAEVGAHNFEAGNNRMYFDAAGLASGIYVYRLSAGKNLTQARKMVVLK
jgi:hypothetical protein